MGQFKKEASRRDRSKNLGKSDGMANVRVKGENFYRDSKKATTVKLFRDEGKPQRNARGDITKDAAFQSRETPKARVEPHRKWFTNTRVISQEALSSFREAMESKSKDPYQVLLKSNKLPMSLLEKNGIKEHAAKIHIGTEPFSDTFGPKAQRKRPKLEVGTMADLAGKLEITEQQYKEKQEVQKLLSGQLGEEEREAGFIRTAREPVFSKGTSKRIWNELYKVIDSSDVVIHVLDARDPLGTRCRSVEKYIQTDAPHKHLLFVLNKCDLVPTSVAAAWVRRLSKEYPTLAFHANINNSFGKGALIQLLRQFSSLHSERKQISVGLIGYPSVGKSSIINTLRKKQVCTVAPIPGETKVWQYVTLMRRIYLIDCPGIVPPSATDTESDILLRGVVRVENVENPEQYITPLLEKCKRHHVERTYNVHDWVDSTTFLEALARKGGRLLKGGEPDLDGVAKMVINDFMRGKLPWFTPVPLLGGEEEKEAPATTKKRKADEIEKEDETGGEGNEKEKDKEEKEDDGDEYDEEEEWGGIVDDEPSEKVDGETADVTGSESESESDSGSETEGESEGESEISESAKTLVAEDSEGDHDQASDSALDAALADQRSKKRRKKN